MGQHAREKLGSFWTDTGLIVLADPCQVFPRVRGNHVSGSYEALLERFLEEGPKTMEPAVVLAGEVLITANERTDWAEHIMLTSGAQGAIGVVITVGVDGWYPVFVERDSDGSIRRIIIECGGQVTP